MLLQPYQLIIKSHNNNLITNKLNKSKNWIKKKVKKKKKELKCIRKLLMKQLNESNLGKKKMKSLY